MSGEPDKRVSKSGKPWNPGWDNVVNNQVKPGEILNPNGNNGPRPPTLTQWMRTFLDEEMRVPMPNGTYVMQPRLQVMARCLVRMAMEPLTGVVRDARMLPLHKAALDHVLSRCDPIKLIMESRRIEIVVTGKSSEVFATTLKARVDQTGELDPTDILEALDNAPID